MPGQTSAPPTPMPCSLGSFKGGPDNCPARHDEDEFTCHVCQRPSMEGRTIARPDATLRGSDTSREQSLQWRAGQLPGQTSKVT